jgi:hypothetical protein
MNNTGAALLLLVLPICRSAHKSKDNAIVLPNPRLLRCKASDCSPLWLTKSSESTSVFPRQMAIGKWVVPRFEKSPIKLWRVTTENFANHLRVTNKMDEKRGTARPVEKQVIFPAF